ncbi:DUF3631 domain-containing protein [Streptomyces uncialis]|uniref:DUF3631 domain-containing protein n=1 Tax=Streptomyces uncialis TaxID=1048205 RepID=UPI00386A1C44|nr:DUF3631 domain-containing protein [Streptomyces uncialis]
MTTTTFPTLLDKLAATLRGTELPPENPHHRAILDALLEVQRLDEQLTGPALPALDQLDGTQERLEQLTAAVAERLAAGHELALLISSRFCCCTDAEEDIAGDDEDFLSCPGEHARPSGIIHAVLDVFAEFGNPDALASGDLVAELRRLPGVAEGRWRYADLTQARLAQLLAPYEISTRDVTLPDGRRRKSYRRAALAALAGCS